MEDSYRLKQSCVGVPTHSLRATETQTPQDNHIDVQRPGSPEAVPNTLSAHTASQAGASNRLGELGQDSGVLWRLEKPQTDSPSPPEGTTRAPGHPPSLDTTPGNLAKRKREDSHSASPGPSKRRYINSVGRSLSNPNFLQLETNGRSSYVFLSLAGPSSTCACLIQLVKARDPLVEHIIWFSTNLI